MNLDDYASVVGPETLEELRVIADHVSGRRLLHVNSTAVGGGVAEILTRLVPLLQQLGVDARWEVMRGDEAFFEMTKTLHNVLHGSPGHITAEMVQSYRRVTEMNLEWMDLEGDAVVIHDPQPAGLVDGRRGSGQRWTWRCHIDVSGPSAGAWEFLLPHILKYDATIFSMPDFAQILPVPQFMIAPSIDPLSDKNREMDEKEIREVMDRFQIDRDRPVLTQISRFDRLKDPIGVIETYRIVKRRHDCQLVLAGGGAADDPEGQAVLAEVRERAEGDPDIKVLELPPFSDLAINALVRGSTIVLQKSIREGFGLTVSEALWKRKPVIGSAVGGIRLQILDGITGFLAHTIEGTAHRARQLLSDAKMRRRMGENGREHVKENFLITRHLKDYLLLLLALDRPEEHIVEIA